MAMSINDKNTMAAPSHCKGPELYAPSITKQPGIDVHEVIHMLSSTQGRQSYKMMVTGGMPEHVEATMVRPCLPRMRRRDISWTFPSRSNYTCEMP